MFNVTKETLIEFITPFAVTIGAIAVLLLLLAAWTVLTSESGDVRVDLEAINIRPVLSNRWITYDRLRTRVKCCMSPSLFEAALTHLCEKGELQKVKSRRTGRVFYRLAAA